MESRTTQQKRILIRHIRSRRWRKILSVLSAVVVSVTTYALILPAITASTTTYCGLEEHKHTEDCYELRLVCTLEEGEDETVVVDPGHTHGADLLVKS